MTSAAPDSSSVTTSKPSESDDKKSAKPRKIHLQFAEVHTEVVEPTVKDEERKTDLEKSGTEILEAGNLGAGNSAAETSNQNDGWFDDQDGDWGDQSGEILKYYFLNWSVDVLDNKEFVKH